MFQQIQFETPENIQISYQPAGLGTRFAAWVLDQIILTFLLVCTFFLLACCGVASTQVVRDAFKSIEGTDGPDPAKIGMYFIGLIALVWGFGSFLYYSSSEYFWKGQTIGKARMKIRVVKSTGFALDSPSILIRNIFRIVDHFAVMWIVPFVNSKSQRLGDMVAGTVVVSEQIDNQMTLRQDLADAPRGEAMFRFSASALKSLNERQLEAVERLLQRWGSLKDAQRIELGTQVTSLIAKQLNIDPPAQEQQLAFLKDLLAAEFRRQHLDLG